MPGSQSTILTDGLHPIGVPEIPLPGNVNDQDIAFLHHFNDSNADSSLIGHTLTLSAGASIDVAEKKFGGGSLFTGELGVQNWEVGSHPVWDCITTHGYVVDFWMNPTSANQTGVVLGMGINNTYRWKILLNTDQTLTWEVAEPLNSYSQTTIGTVPLGSWSWVALEFDPFAATTNAFWIGGTRELLFNGGQTLWSINNGATFLTGGGDQKFSGSNGANYHGYLDELRIIMRSPADQRNTWNAAATIPIPTAAYPDPS